MPFVITINFEDCHLSSFDTVARLTDALGRLSYSNKVKLINCMTYKHLFVMTFDGELNRAKAIKRTLERFAFERGDYQMVFVSKDVEKYLEQIGKMYSRHVPKFALYNTLQ